MTSSYNYNQYGTTFDNQANDRNSQMFWDAVSVTSSDRNSIALSIYHSVPELQYDENSAANRQIRNEQASQFSVNESLKFLIRTRVKTEKEVFLHFFLAAFLHEILSLFSDLARQ